MVQLLTRKTTTKKYNANKANISVQGYLNAFKYARQISYIALTLEIVEKCVRKVKYTILSAKNANRNLFTVQKELIMIKESINA